jgi:uncharacterized protein YxeA
MKKIIITALLTTLLLYGANKIVYDKITVYDNFNLYTVKHDNHKWVVLYQSDHESVSLLHHPSCCQGKGGK